MKEVGKRLKALREGIGISQMEMANAIGSSQSRKMLENKKTS